jgi:hypothetical protein
MAQAHAQLTQLPEQFATEDQFQAITITRHGRPCSPYCLWGRCESIAETLEFMGDTDLMAAMHQGSGEITRDESDIGRSVRVPFARPGGSRASSTSGPRRQHCSTRA